MRRKLAGLALGLAAVAMLALSGCGAMTPAEAAAGIEMDLGIQMDGRMRISYDPDTIYENMEGTADMMGFRVPASMEDAWTRTELDTFPQTDGSGAVVRWDLPADRLSIDEEVIEPEGAPAVCPNPEVTGEDVSRALGLCSAIRFVHPLSWCCLTED